MGPIAAILSLPTKQKAEPSKLHKIEVIMRLRESGKLMILRVQAPPIWFVVPPERGAIGSHSHGRPIFPPIFAPPCPLVYNRQVFWNPVDGMSIWPHHDISLLMTRH